VQLATISTRRTTRKAPASQVGAIIVRATHAFETHNPALADALPVRDAPV
jgi:hypothetical protein